MALRMNRTLSGWHTVRYAPHTRHRAARATASLATLQPREHSRGESWVSPAHALRSSSAAVGAARAQFVHTRKVS
jgi:hypothetical protein